MRLPFSLTSKLSLALLLGISLFLINLRYQQYKTQVAIDREKQNLKQQIDSLTKKNEDLSGSLSYFSSEGFHEQAARQQLNLKRDGEIVFGFTDQPAQAEQNSGLEEDKIPNYEKWVKFFFSNSSNN